MNLYFDTVYEQIAEMAAGDLLRSAQERWQTRTLAYSGCALHRERKKAKSERGLKWGVSIIPFFIWMGLTANPQASFVIC